MTKTGFALLLAALAAGGAIGYVVGSGGAGSDGLPAPAAGGAPAPAPDRPRPKPSLPPADARSVDDAVHDLEAPEPEHGDGVINGVVREEDGTPVEGALVRALRRVRWRSSRAYLVGGPPPEDPPIEQVAREYAERTLQQRSARTDTRSGADGTFTLTGLLDETHSMQAFKEGFQIQPDKWQAKPGTKVTFTAKRVFRIPLSVLMPDGSVPEIGAQIEMRQAGRTEGQWWSPETGAIAVEAGEWKLKARLSDDRSVVSDEVGVRAGPGIEPAAVTLELGGQPGIRGTITFPEGDANGHCEVKAIRVVGGTPPDPERLRREGERTWVHARSDGKYSISNLTPGPWLVGIVSGGKVLDSRTVTVPEAGPVDADFEYPALDPAECVTLRIEGPEGEVVTDVYFQSGYFRDDNPMWGNSRSEKLPDGRYRVTNCEVPEDRRGAGLRYFVDVTSRRLGRKRVEYAAGTAEATVRFDEPATLEVTVRDYVGSGWEGRIRLSVSTPDSRRFGGFGMNRDGLSAEGVVEFGPLTPGEYEIVLSVGDRRGSSTTALREPVTLKSGKNAKSIGIPPLYSLTVVVEGDIGRDWISLRSRDRETGRVSRSAHVTDGRAVFEGLPAGDYVLSASRAGDMEVTVPGRGVVQFAPVARTAYCVEIRDPEGGFARAGLREGDLVVGVDGREFTDEEQMRALLILAGKKERAVLTVLRGAKSIEVPVDLSVNRPGSDAAGGVLRPSAR